MHWKYHCFPVMLDTLKECDCSLSTCDAQKTSTVGCGVHNISGKTRIAGRKNFYYWRSWKTSETTLIKRHFTFGNRRTTRIIAFTRAFIQDALCVYMRVRTCMHAYCDPVKKWNSIRVKWSKLNTNHVSVTLKENWLQIVCRRNCNLHCNLP